jgi:hypothetical protein
MNKNIDLSTFRNVLGDFRRTEAAVRSTAQTAHGDPKAWRLAEEGVVAAATRGEN